MTFLCVLLSRRQYPSILVCKEFESTRTRTAKEALHTRPTDSHLWQVQWYLLPASTFAWPDLRRHFTLGWFGARRTFSSPFCLCKLGRSCLRKQARNYRYLSFEGHRLWSSNAKISDSRGIQWFPCPNQQLVSIGTEDRPSLPSKRKSSYWR